MSRSEPAIFTNMCMICDGNGNLLVQNRRKNDWPGIAFPGGHVEPNESFVDSVIREVREETGLTVEDPTLCGIKQFQENSGVRYVVLFFRACWYHGDLESSPEGEVFWIPRDRLADYPLSLDFMDMLKIFESEALSEFYYYQEDGGWKYRLL